MYLGELLDFMTLNEKVDPTLNHTSYSTDPDIYLHLLHTPCSQESKHILSRKNQNNGQGMKSCRKK